MSKKSTVAAKHANQKRFSSWLDRRRQAFRKNRLHQSFRITKRRDYVRSLELPGYIAFSFEVLRTLIQHKRVFFGLILLYAFLMLVFGGISTQNIQGQINELVGEETMPFIFLVSQAGLEALAGIGGGGPGLSDVQQVYLAVFVLLVWLSSVWLLREIMADKKPSLRDGVYNSGAPVVSTALLLILAMLQLLPLGIVVIAYISLSSVGLISGGIGAMLFSMIALLVLTLCLYWITATLVALVVVTLPGMYPLRALRVASNLVAGRRLRVMYRLIWLIGMLLIVLLIAMVPVILLNQWLQSLADWVSYIPLVPVASAIVSATLTVVAASYIYILYRKVVAHDARTSR